ncbi:hypothetical protein M441DRAFT_379222 [Trichoderma asperellum CBS 433.97]|uniref:Uncharacterized protein n=1 Tax=Trichoderma asperellum (strain ATCC 204424 / CBS 433.97 / NBRC 101777) TaxID=1042311 RepID=A0A2T3ZAV9_TRIA4|nr:hypothetical protein M441DRAFT_379222 [Trichoderma asperellum CBS 433.97]PTB41935.1 hypothetical protein M441DRAFT_379222 [Trichoderma asperellum CBS 433.97]
MNRRLRWDVSPTAETLCPGAVRSVFRIGRFVVHLSQNQCGRPAADCALKIDETSPDAVDCDEQGGATVYLDQAIVLRNSRKPWNRHCEDILTPLLSKMALASLAEHRYPTSATISLFRILCDYNVACCGFESSCVLVCRCARRYALQATRLDSQMRTKTMSLVVNQPVASQPRTVTSRSLC